MALDICSSRILESTDVFYRWNEIVEERKKFEDLTKAIEDVLCSGKKILIMGNGGSAAEATHIAAEFLGKCVIDVGPRPVISLCDSTSAILAISNDFGFDYVFQRQVIALASEGDLVIGLTTSGLSKNVLLALDAARDNDCITSLWTSEKCPKEILEKYHFTLVAPTESTPRAQELHLLWGHIIAESLEIV